MSSRILLLHTGGTFGMAPSDDLSALAPRRALGKVLQEIPELTRLAEIVVETPFNKDSTNMEPDDILALARLVRARAAAFDGVVIIHGTDTMAFTASVLGFLLADLEKPTVLTGSQRPLAYVRSDARSNLVDAVALASSGVREIGICFGDHWLRGVAAEKTSVCRYGAFETPNLPPLAELGLHIQMHPHAGAFRRAVPAGLEALDMEIAVYTPHPGMGWRLPPPETRGVLIQAYGAGNLPVERADLRALMDHLRERRIPVVITSQCISGGVDLAIYQLGRLATEQGCISGGFHTRWAALAKLGLCLGAGMDLPEIRSAFATSWAGEPV